MKATAMPTTSRRTIRIVVLVVDAFTAPQRPSGRPALRTVVPEWIIDALYAVVTVVGPGTRAAGRAPAASVIPS
jgi:hypothetical protein